jgi:hypothetical protein
MSGNLYTEFGTSITLSFEAEKSVTLSRLNNKFVHKAGDDLYGFLGIDRVEQAETVPELDHHMLGSVLVKGVAFGPKFEYKITLQKLTKTEYKDIQDMVWASHKSGKLLRLDDKILSFTEYGGRTRAIAPGTPVPVVSGNFSTYYASFKVWVPELTRKFYVRDGEGELEFTAVEYDKPLTV